MSAVTPKLIREDFATYQAKSKQFMSSHQLAEFRRCPAYFRQLRVGLASKPDSEYFLIGRALSCLVTEGREQFDKNYVVGGPINEKTGKSYGFDTKAFREWAAQQSREILHEDHGLLIAEMAASVKSHPIAKHILCDKCGVAEGVIRAKLEGVECQCRIDWFTYPTPAMIVDLKTCRSLDKFESDARDYGYLNQLAFYRSLANAAGFTVEHCQLIAVEKEEPFRCGVFTLSDLALLKARNENRDALIEYGQCEKNSYWPTRFERERVIDLV